MKGSRGLLRWLVKRPWALGAVLAVAIAGVVLGLSLGHKRTSATSQSLGATVRVSRGDITKTVTAYGSVVPKQQYTFTFPGTKIKELKVSVGDRVTQGQVLVQLDSTQEELALLQAERALIEAKAQGVPAVIRERELAYSLAKANLENTTIKAPFPGVVTDITQATSATENWSLTLIDTSELFVEVSVDQLDVPSLKVGQRGIAVIEALSDKTFPVEILKIGGRAITRGSSTVVSVTTKLLQVSPEILVGYTARVEITVASAQNVLRVPISALVRSGRGWTVMKVVDNQAVSQPVTVGITSDLWAEIKSGLQEGDVVLLNPSRTTTTPAQGAMPPQGTTPPAMPGGGFIPPSGP
ncbi:MAG: biotin/lipoyl-binding protein [Candidatus Bipolaricaulota bacterium]|nr:biotin/lipoyl-binding protein [Candidatus Bipolaricaulota bacterium]MDW8127336.1 biotin/lipoyl-binding protein [Candidatus Bipolaricaulota bacterium]